MMNTRRSNSGAALLTVLIIVFLIMAIITDIAVRNYSVLRRLSNQKTMEQGYSILYSGVDFGRAALATSGSSQSYDALNDLWAQPIAKTKVVDDIEMGGYVIDEQSKFNLNDMVQSGIINKAIVAQFASLLGYLNIPPGVAQNIALYMAEPAFQQPIIDQYASAKPAYRPAGRPLVDLSELLLIQGINPQWLYKLKKYVTVIPSSQDYQNQNQLESQQANNPPINPNRELNNGNLGIPVNINTASAEVIASRTGLPLSLAQVAVAMRSTTPFKSIADINLFLQRNGIISDGSTSKNDIYIGNLTVGSQYFTIHVQVDKADYQFNWLALVYRANRNGQWPTILWQHPE